MWIIFVILFVPLIIWDYISYMKDEKEKESIKDRLTRLENN